MNRNRIISNTDSHSFIVVYDRISATIEHIAKTVGDMEIASNHRACTGVLASHPDCRDVQLIGVTITFHGVELLSDTKLELNAGRRYGLLGMNGCGEYE